MRLNVFAINRLLKKPAILLIALGFSATGLVCAANLDEIINAEQSKLKLAQASQSKVETLDTERRRLYDEYKAVLKETEGLRVYNKQLSKQIASQIKEMTRIEQTIENVTVMQRQITPLMLRMIEGLEQFLALDIPFLKEERERRIVFLKEVLDRSDVSVAEQFRRIIEAYQIENDYGATIEAYKDNLDVDGVEREVEFLRVGRVAWVYQTADGKYAGVWNQESKSWDPLDGSYRKYITNGLKIARKQQAPDMIVLPVKAPELAQ